MKIKQLKVKKYRIFDELNIDLSDKNGETLNTVLFAGENGCGKTTILNLIYQALSSTPIHPPFCNHLEITIEFNPSQIELIHKVLKDYRYSGDPIFDMLYENVLASSNIINFIYKEENGIQVRNDYILFHLLGSENYNNKTGLKIIYTNKEIDKYIEQEEFNENVKKEILLFYSELVQTQAQDPDFLYDSQTLQKNFPMFSTMQKLDDEIVFFKSLNNQVIRLEDLSSGEKQIIYRFFYLRRSGIKDGIIIVDEPENSLHPKWQQRIIQLYHRNGKYNQVILATHSPHIISSLPADNLFLLTSQNNSSIEVINVGRSNKNTKGLEPNRILLEIMGTPLRDIETQSMIDALMNLLNPKDHKTPEAQKMIGSLREMLGSKDPFIIRLEHQLRMFKTGR